MPGGGRVGYKAGMLLAVTVIMTRPGVSPADEVWPEFDSFSPEDGIRIQPGAQLRLDAAVHDSDIVDYGDGSRFSRARFSLEVAVGQDWASRVSYNLVNDGGLTGFSSAYIDYTGLESVRLRFGQFKEPFSLQNMTGSSNVNFIERSLADIFTTERTLGAGLFAGEDHWSLGAGLFTRDIGGELDSDSAGASGRLTFTPLNSDGHVLHLGGSLSWRHTGDDETLSFDPKPESGVSIDPLVSTTNPLPIDAEDFYRYGVEAAWMYGRFTLQGEYMGVAVNRETGGNPDIDFNGYYAEVSWFLTEDRRAYRGWTGTFGSVDPNADVGHGGIGGWQIAARISNIDLSDADINGGEEHNLTLGLNWYPNANLRFSANYIKVLEIRGGPLPGNEPSIFLVRGQLDF